MKFSAIGLPVFGSLLCVAFSQSSEARSIRADQGQNGWVNTAAPYTASPFSLNPGVSTPNAVSIGNSSPSELTDDVGFQASSATEYNWYASPTTFAQALTQVTPLEQIVVYTLGAGTVGSTSLNGDTEIEFNYVNSNFSNYSQFQSQLSQNPGATATFTIGGVTYSALVSSIATSQNDFIFSSNGGFVGSLVTDNSGTASLSSSLEGWSSGGTVHTAPEIDPTSAASAVTLLAGFLAIVRVRARTRSGVANS